MVIALKKIVALLTAGEMPMMFLFIYQGINFENLGKNEILGNQIMWYHVN